MWWRAGRRLLSTAEVKRHRPVMKLENHRPVVQNDTWVAPNAAVVGNVRLGDEVSVWYGAVVRGDPNFVRIGPQSNVQEKAVIQTVETVETGFPAVVDVGECVSIGPGCVLRSCTVGKNVELGAGCLVLDGALIEDNVKLLPGTLVPPGGRIPSGEVWGGKPAKFVAKITEEEARRFFCLASTRS
ncbi:hypothetical protein CTAYLR_010074 [Chrysophaeum taylorii]|uniref:Gamma carbonic anhydrase family protein n=1 Tax=Chrysophaeum taylorii TaxID=2483200 RepID=A0AAD7UA34_9STRA|nr:hypothetical protein CTAYLR_010074 [Chrysophaeum taylorii]